ncbi:MAG: hypothetical protein JWO60_2712 [Frankiales bacterium]|nr:hypothetical protein [Frankiales bacterium]
MQQQDTGEAARAPSRRTLPPGALADLRAAYAEELADRLPRLVRAAEAGATGPDVVRDAHSLGSSSFVVDEPEAGRLAREVEARLLAGEPVDDVVAQLADLLSGWTA